MLLGAHASTHDGGTPALNTLLAVVFGVGVLFMFYRAIRVGWPDNYMALDSGFEYAITSHPTRYVGFRFFPIYLVSVFIAVSLDNADTDAVLAVLLVCGLHAALHNGWAILRLLKTPEGTRQYPLIVLHVGVIACIFISGLVALWTRSLWTDLVPSAHELGVTLWTAAFAGITGVFLLSITRANRSAHEALSRSRESIAAQLYEVARIECAQHGTDFLFVQAIMISENVQRPPWFRKLERVKGWAFPAGTYGIMQVSSDRPISDEESIRLAVSGRLKGVQVPWTWQGVAAHQRPRYDYEELARLARDYNPDNNFVSAVRDIYGTLWSDALRTMGF